MSNLSAIVSFLEGKGLSSIAIAGIIGNLQIESGLNPSAANSSEGAIGIAQWEGGRRTALQNWARQHGGSETNLNTQLGYLWHELSTSYSSVLHGIQNATSAADAARIWDVGPGGVNSGTGFENSSGSVTAARQAEATQYANTGGVSNGFAAPQAGGMGADRSLSSTTSAGDQPNYKTVDGLGGLLESVPELRRLLDQAQSGNWSLPKFENEVEDSDWWKNHSQTARTWLITMANDPATAQQSLHNAENSVSTLAHQLGFSVNAKQLSAIATSALLSGNDSNQQWLTQQLGRRQDYSDVKNLDSLQGGMANTAQQLQAMAGDYGFTWTPAQIAQFSEGILTGKTTIDTYKQKLQGWAASAFPAFRKEIMTGTTLKEIANPYINSMSNLLEVDPGQLSTYTPMIRRALQGTSPAGAKPDQDPTATPLWKFEQQLRSDPRWQYTQNAHQTMASALLQLGGTFGFGPETVG